MTVYKLLTHLKVNTPSQAAGIESDIFIFAALACGKNTKVVFFFFFSKYDYCTGSSSDVYNCFLESMFVLIIISVVIFW